MNLGSMSEADVVGDPSFVLILGILSRKTFPTVPLRTSGPANWQG